MRKMRKVIVRRDALRGCGRCGREVPLIAHNRPRLVRSLLERRSVGNGVVIRIRTVVPNDFQRVAPLHSGPGVAPDHGHAADRIEQRRPGWGIDLNDAPTAWALETRASTCTPAR